MQDPPVALVSSGNYSSTLLCSHFTFVTLLFNALCSFINIGFFKFMNEVEANAAYVKNNSSSK